MIFETPLDFIAKKRCLQGFVESLDQWKGESDQSCIPSFIQVLISTPVRDLSAQNFPQKVGLDTSVMEVLQIFQFTRTVLVNRSVEDNTSEGYPSEIILSRLTFLQHAVTAPSLSTPLSGLINSIATPCWVDTRETLDIVLQSMIGSGFEEVGVMEGGIVMGILHVDEIFAFLAKELALACPDADEATKAQRGVIDEASVLAETRSTARHCTQSAARTALPP